MELPPLSLPRRRLSADEFLFRDSQRIPVIEDLSFADQLDAPSFVVSSSRLPAPSRLGMEAPIAPGLSLRPIITRNSPHFKESELAWHRLARRQEALVAAMAEQDETHVANLEWHIEREREACARVVYLEAEYSRLSQCARDLQALQSVPSVPLSDHERIVLELEAKFETQFSKARAELQLQSSTAVKDSAAEQARLSGLLGHAEERARDGAVRASELAGQLLIVEDRLARVTEDASVALAKVARLEEDLGRTTAEAERATSATSAAADEALRQAAELERTSGKSVDLEKLLAEQTAESARLLARAGEAERQVTLQTERHRIESQSRSSAIASLEAQVALWQGKYSEQSAACVRELDALRAAVVEKDQALAAVQIRVDSTKPAVAQMQEQQRLEASLHQDELLRVQLDAESKALRLLELAGQLQDMSTRLSRLPWAEQELAEERARNTDLRAANRELVAAVEGLRSGRAQYTDEIAVLERRLNVAGAERASVEKELLRVQQSGGTTMDDGSKSTALFAHTSLTPTSYPEEDHEIVRARTDLAAVSAGKTMLHDDQASCVIQDGQIISRKLSQAQLGPVNVVISSLVRSDDDNLTPAASIANADRVPELILARLHEADLPGHHSLAEVMAAQHASTGLANPIVIHSELAGAGVNPVVLIVGDDFAPPLQRAASHSPPPQRVATHSPPPQRAANALTHPPQRDDKGLVMPLEHIDNAIALEHIDNAIAPPGQCVGENLVHPPMRADSTVAPPLQCSDGAVLQPVQRVDNAYVPPPEVCNLIHIDDDFVPPPQHAAAHSLSPHHADNAIPQLPKQVHIEVDAPPEPGILAICMPLRSELVATNPVPTPLANAGVVSPPLDPARLPTAPSPSRPLTSRPSSPRKHRHHNCFPHPNVNVPE